MTSAVAQRSTIPMKRLAAMAFLSLERKRTAVIPELLVPRVTMPTSRHAVVMVRWLTEVNRRQSVALANPTTPRFSAAVMTLSTNSANRAVVVPKSTI